MLTPGSWTLENTDIVAGCFNPGFLPSLFIRTFAMFLLGGLFGIIVGTTIKDDLDLKEQLIAFSAKWVLPAAFIIPFMVWWYWNTLPESTVALVQGGTVGVGGGNLEAITRHFWLAVTAGALIVIGTLLVAARPRSASTGGAIALFLIAQLGVLGAEFFREMARKPYVVYGVLYSNGLWARDAADAEYMQSCYMQNARWSPDVESGGLDHGQWVFRLQCASCHTLHGYRSITDRTEGWAEKFAQDWLARMHETNVMPPFQGDEADRRALAMYLTALHDESGGHGDNSASSLGSDSDGATSRLVSNDTRENVR